MEFLESFLDWRQILNSFFGSLIAALIVTPAAIYTFKWTARKARIYRQSLGVGITIIGICAFIFLVGPSALEQYKENQHWSSIWKMARGYGGDEPQPRLLFTCSDECLASIEQSAVECLDSKTQRSAEYIGHYGSRNAAGLRIFVSCMKSYGYSAGHCTSQQENCVTVPDTGFRNRGSAVHYRYKCAATKDEGIVCAVK